MVAGTIAAMATSAALFQMKGDPAAKGQVIDVSLLESLYALMGPDAAIMDKLGVARQRGEGTKISSIRGVFQSKDGHWLGVSTATEEIVQRFIDALKRQDILQDPRFSDFAGRIKHKSELDKIIQGEFSLRTREEMLQLAEENRVTIGPLYT